MTLLIQRTITCIILAVALYFRIEGGTFSEIVKMVLLFFSGWWSWELIMMLRFRNQAPNVKAINIGDPKSLEESDLPPELKKVLWNFAKTAKKVAKELNEKGQEKCKDPHCKDCWGLGNNEHKYEK